MKKPIAIVSAFVAVIGLLFIGVVAPAVADSSTITKYGDTFTYNGSNSWTIKNTDNDQAIKNIGNTTNTTLCSNYDTGLGKPCANGASYTFTGDTSRTGYDCAYVQIDGGNSGSQDTVPGDDSKSVCVPITTTPTDSAATVTTTAASCTSAETVAEVSPATYATWTAVAYSGNGNLHFSAVATAASGHKFPTTAAGTSNGITTTVSSDGLTETISGDLTAQLTTGCTIPKVCIPDSSVSYTYSHSNANTGWITVTDVANSTGVLCNPFYVTATSWKYTNNASIWPQKVDVVDQLGKISTPGHYQYTAAVGCGQGDIYASTSATAPSLNPANYPTDTGYLNGPNNPFQEHFLSDMGFTQTGSSGATYYVDANSCFVPASETGIPSPSSASCANPNGNELSLPAVVGGTWTVSNAGYSKTYAIDTATDITTVPNGYSTYTVTLSDGSNTDGYQVDTKVSSWTPVDMSTLDCNTQATPIAPTANDSVGCFAGTIVIPSITGVTYYVDGKQVTSGSTIQNLTGSHTVTATADTGYEFAPNTYPAKTNANPDGGWTYDLGTTDACVIPIAVGDCSYDATNSTSNEAVTLTFDNTGSKTSSTFQVGLGGTTYTVDAGKSLDQNVGSITSAGGSFDVYINGSTTPYTVKVPSFATCIPVVPGDPDVTQLTCNAVTNTPNSDGTITVQLDPLLTYTVTGPAGPDSTTRTADADNTGAPTGTYSGLPAGDYIVSVVPAAGYTIAGPTAWPLTVPIAPTDCTVAPSSTVASCTGPASNPTEVQGQISITLNNDIVYSVTGTGITGSQTLSAASTSFADGTYTVSAVLTPAAVAAGTRLLGDTTWPSVTFGALCLPILPAWHANATSTDATCSATGSTAGFITLTHEASEAGKVNYSIENDATHSVVNVGHTVTKVKEAPGSYTVTASPVDPKDGISGKSVFDLTVGAATGDCGTLAFTGGGFAGYLGVTLALGMLFLGAAALWMRRRFGSRATH